MAQVDYSAIGLDDYGSIVIPESSSSGQVGQALNGIGTLLLQKASDAFTAALGPSKPSAPSSSGVIVPASNVSRLIAIGALILGGVLLYRALK